MVQRKFVKTWHTWDSSWYNPHWHGKTYGLEVDPWSAVEPVPYLCAVSLSSNCEEFSEPKRTTREMHTKTSQSGSPRNLAHVNKFSILAPDDNEFTGEGCTPMHTSRNNGNAVCTAALETKLSFHRGFGTSMLNDHQVPYLAASGGDSRGVHHVSGSGWRSLSAITGRRSAERVAPESLAENVPLMETEASRQGPTYHTADGGAIKNKGAKTVTMYSETGDQYRARYPITDVTRPLNSVSRVCDQGKMCCSRRLEVGSSIVRLVGTCGFLGNTECMCCTHG